MQTRHIQTDGLKQQILEAGTGPLVLLIHGFPELGISWRAQVQALAEVGFHAVAADMRGYGSTEKPTNVADYSILHLVGDMVDLVRALGETSCVVVGHDWGAPVVWSLAQQHPDRCHGVATLCVPYIPQGFAPEAIIPLADRAIYPEATFPAAQWDYMMFYRENFAAACAGFDGDVRATVKLLFRAGSAAGKGQPAATAFPRANGGWFGPGGKAPDMPRDETVLTQEDENRYTAALEANGFFGPDSWYMNGRANMAYAARAPDGGRLAMPALFLHAAFDYVCETLDSTLAEPMRAHCADLTEAIVESGHWMAQEKPAEVNAALAKWLAARLPDLWPKR